MTMIEKIKGIMSAQESIDAMAASLKELRRAQETTASSSKKTSEAALKSEQSIASLEKSQSEFLSRMERELTEFAALRSRMNEELSDLKILKSTLQEKLVSQIVDEVRSEMVTQVERLRTDVKSYNDLKTQLQFISTTMGELRTEVDKFVRISKHIQERDFELTAHAKRLASADREKVELLKKIDNLERLVARTRRDVRS